MYFILARDPFLGANVKDWFDRRRIGLAEMIPLDEHTELTTLASSHATAVLVIARRPDELLLRACREAARLADISGAPVVAACEEATESERITILDAGADAVVQPFDLPLLAWRVMALCEQARRRTGAADLSLATQPGRSSVMVDGRRVELTIVESAILRMLVQYSNRVVGRAQLEQQLWGEAKVKPRTLDVHVARLRRKLGERGNRIETIRKVGYRYTQYEADDGKTSVA
jgi:DNA-binding response OmpR family regulator